MFFFLHFESGSYAVAPYKNLYFRPKTVTKSVPTQSMFFFSWVCLLEFGSRQNFYKFSYRLHTYNKWVITILIISL